MPSAPRLTLARVRASCTRDFNRASAASFAHAAVAPLRGSPSPVLMAANPPSAMVEGTLLPEGAIESRVPGGGGGQPSPPSPCPKPGAPSHPSWRFTDRQSAFSDADF